MLSARKNAVLVMVLLVAAALSLVSASGATAATTTVGFAQQPRITVRTGQSFYLTVAVTDASDLYGWQFDTEYNSTYLEFIRVARGPMLSSDGASAYLVPPSVQPGKALHVAATRLARDAGVSGSGEVAYVFFRALKDTPSTGTTVSLKNVLLVDRNALEIERSYVNGGRCGVVISASAPEYVQPPVEGAYLPLVLRAP